MAKILILDDDWNILKSLKLALEVLGHEVWTDLDGSHAEKIVGDHDIQLVITDIMMPNCDGIEVVRQIEETFPEVAVFAISGVEESDRVGYLEMAKTFGAKEALHKPIELRELVDRMTQWNITP